MISMAQMVSLAIRKTIPSSFDTRTWILLDDSASFSINHSVPLVSNSMIFRILGNSISIDFSSFWISALDAVSSLNTFDLWNHDLISGLSSIKIRLSHSKTRKMWRFPEVECHLPWMHCSISELVISPTRLLPSSATVVILLKSEEQSGRFQIVEVVTTSCSDRRCSGQNLITQDLSGDKREWYCITVRITFFFGRWNGLYFATLSVYCPFREIINRYMVSTTLHSRWNEHETILYQLNWFCQRLRKTNWLASL